MVNPLYPRALATANRMIASFGKPAVLTRKTVSGPAHDQTITSTDYDVTMVETGYSLTDRDSTLIQTGDRLGLISMDGEAEPKKGDKLTIDSVVYSFVELQPLNPGGVTVFYEFQARQ